jgi:hypothetical protein
MWCLPKSKVKTLPLPRFAWTITHSQHGLDIYFYGLCGRTPKITRKKWHTSGRQINKLCPLPIIETSIHSTISGTIVHWPYIQTTWCSVAIVTDRDMIFTNKLWQDIFRSMKVSLHYCSAYHPKQMDTQRESTNTWKITSGVWHSMSPRSGPPGYL